LCVQILDLIMINV